MSNENKIAELLQKLQTLKDRGLIDENYYRRKREELLNAYFAQRFPKVSRRDHRSKYYIIAVFAIIIIAGFLVIEYSLMLSPNTVTITQTLIKTQTVTSTKARTILTTIIIPTTSQHPSFVSSPKRITFERTLKKCQFIYYPLQVEKGDEVKVHWESNDESTYVAIGTDADISELKNNYCETNIITWDLAFPSAGHSYSGALEFKISSSAKCYVIVANGNFGCLYSDCPIGVSITIEIT